MAPLVQSYTVPPSGWSGQVGAIGLEWLLLITSKKGAINNRYSIYYWDKEKSHEKNQSRKIYPL